MATPARKPPADDGFNASNDAAHYDAAAIEVLEGLEPVRRRPGMYIGGTDERALHHLFAEVLDNAMDEAIAGHADRVEVSLDADGVLTVTDNGRGIPVDPHPRFPDKSAVEVILTTLHAGAKFSDAAYQASGGLHGVGVSVVNALSERLEVEIARDKALYAQAYVRGEPQGPLKRVGKAPNRRGTSVRFRPDPEIFGEGAAFKPARLFAMTRSKAYLHRAARLTWRCAPELLGETDTTPAEALLHFPGGLADFLTETLGERVLAAPPFAGRVGADGAPGSLEWAVGWTGAGFGEDDHFARSYCNGVPTPQGGTHEQGLRAALTKGLRAYGEMAGEKRAAQLTGDDVVGAAATLVSVFIREPEFQGQTKDRLANAEAARLVEQAVRDPFDHWLAASPKQADALLDFVITRAEERQRRKRAREVARKSVTRKLRLPGKLADCARAETDESELFLVEGDSAGGSAKQARNRDTQAVLPLRGKILNVAQATSDKILANQEIADLTSALGCGLGGRFRLEDLRYERIIIMTDADVDGAHIATLLITFFLRQTPGLAEAGRLYLAMPPLYRLARGGQVAYARDDGHREALMADTFKGSGAVEISRFKGLGEMMPRQLKETTMDPATRTLARVRAEADDATTTNALLETLMGRKPELRFRYIQDNVQFVRDLDI